MNSTTLPSIVICIPPTMSQNMAYITNPLLSPKGRIFQYVNLVILYY